MSLSAEWISRFSSKLARKTRARETFSLSGLDAPAEVVWDEAGVPHLSAQSRADLFLLQGFISARERAFQMDFTRRAVSGRLSEILGARPMAWRDLTIHLKDRTIPEGDLLLRTLGLRKAAEASVAQASDATRVALEAYARGATLAFERERPALEMRLLRFSPYAWTPADSFSVIKGMAFELSMAWRTVLILDAIAYRLKDEPEKMRVLFPSWPGHATPPAAWNGLREHSADDVDLEESYRAFTAMGGAHVGSNAWAVAGHRTQSGKPILCGDPHLMMTAPSSHFAVHLQCPGMNVIGTSVPGIPGVIMGHNEHIAWSMTASVAQDADIFVEEINLGDKTYKVGEEWVPLEIRNEEITVKGASEPERHEVHSTRHGPLIHEVTHRFHERDRTFGHAIRWIGQDASRDIDAVLEMNVARNWTEYRQALTKITAPSLNFLYADVEGHIGWQLAGAFPVRKDGSDGLLPADGASGASDWERYLTLDELPHLFDPESGVIVSANTKPVGDAYPWPLGNTWEPYFRYQRIHELLEAGVEGRKLDIHDMARIQNDQHSVWADKLMRELVRPNLEGAEFSNPDAAHARDLLMSWTGDSRAESNAACVFYKTYDVLVSTLLEEHLGEDMKHAYLEMLNLSVMPMENMIQDASSPLLAGSDLRQRVIDAVDTAARALRAELGPPSGWKWGAVHQLWHRHRLHEVKAFRRIFSVGPFRVGGDGMCVNNAHYLHQNPFEMVLGPGLRHIEDTANWDRSRFILNTGNSGKVGSAGYRDHAAMWARGEYHRLNFSPSSFEGGTSERFEP